MITKSSLSSFLKSFSNACAEICCEFSLKIENVDDQKQEN